MSIQVGPRLMASASPRFTGEVLSAYARKVERAFQTLQKVDIGDRMISQQDISQAAQVMGAWEKEGFQPHRAAVFQTGQVVLVALRFIPTDDPRKQSRVYKVLSGRPGELQDGGMVTATSLGRG